MKALRVVMIAAAVIGIGAAFFSCSGPLTSVPEDSRRIHPHSPLSAADLREILHELPPGETVHVHVDDLDLSARERYQEVVAGAERLDGIVYLEAGLEAGALSSRAARVCHKSVAKTNHSPGCPEKEVRSAGYERIYGSCPHRGYESLPRGRIVDIKCKVCPYRAQYSYEYHTRSGR